MRSVSTPSPEPYKKAKPEKEQVALFTKSAKAMNSTGDEQKGKQVSTRRERAGFQNQRQKRAGAGWGWGNAGAEGVRSEWGSLKKGHLFIWFQPQGRIKIPSRN